MEMSWLMMGTTVTIRVVGAGSPTVMRTDLERAETAMRRVEETLTRFDPTSPLSMLGQNPGRWLAVPDLLFDALVMARMMSRLTGGAYDPTIGGHMAAQGFNRHYMTGEIVDPLPDPGSRPSYRDIWIDPRRRRVQIQKPMQLDLGGVAKGLAVDLGAQALRSWDGYAIDAGGDVAVRGRDPEGRPWAIGIQDPLHPGSVIDCLYATDLAVCTSGTYAPRAPSSHGAAHLWDARSRTPALDLVSLSVAAPLAGLADLVATGAFLLGPRRALALADDLGLAAMALDPAMGRSETSSWRRHRA